MEDEPSTLFMSRPSFGNEFVVSRKISRPSCINGKSIRILQYNNDFDCRGDVFK